MKADEAFKFLDSDLVDLANITKDPWYKRVLRKLGLLRVDETKEWETVEKVFVNEMERLKGVKAEGEAQHEQYQREVQEIKEGKRFGFSHNGSERPSFTHGDGINYEGLCLPLEIKDEELIFIEKGQMKADQKEPVNSKTERPRFVTEVEWKKRQALK